VLISSARAMSSDEDAGAGLRGGNDEAALPRATVQKLLQEHISKDVRLSAEAREILAECCNEFVSLLASEATEVSTKEKKTMVTGQHVLGAMEALGLQTYLEGARASLQETSQEQKTQREAKRVKKKESKGAAMSEAEAIAAQEALFAAARARCYGGGGAP